MCNILTPISLVICRKDLRTVDDLWDLLLASRFQIPLMGQNCFDSKMGIQATLVRWF